MLGRVHGVIFFVVSAIGIARAGNTTCKNTSLDWFTQSVGETPCRVYERLRQACSPEYQMGNMAPAPPGDTCGGQPPTCCCNSVAFALSMLCMNCQYGVGSSIGNDHGFDAGAGAFGLYLNGCGRPTNQSLADTVQAAVCKQGIKIPKSLYELFWVTGDWFYEYTKGTSQLQIQSGKNDSGLCPTSSVSVTFSTVTSSSTSSATSPSNHTSTTNAGAIAGGVIGGVALLILAALAGFFFTRKKRRGIVDLTEENKGPEMDLEPYHIPPGGPQLAQPVGTLPYGAPSSSGWTSTDATSSTSPSMSPPPAPVPRHYKPGLIVPTPTTRAEVYQTQPLLGPPSFSPPSTERHEDSEVLSSAFGLSRSSSGRLPPSYEYRD